MSKYNRVSFNDNGMIPGKCQCFDEDLPCKLCGVVYCEKCLTDQDSTWEAMELSLLNQICPKCARKVEGFKTTSLSTVLE